MHTLNSDPNVSKLQEYTIGLYKEIEAISGQYCGIHPTGAVVDHPALVDALNAGRLFGAGLDVFPEEPLPPDDPILGCEQVVLTPHEADQTPEARDASCRAAVENIIAFLEGKPRVNAAR